MIMCFGALMMIWDDAVNVETTNFGMSYRKDQRYTKNPPNLKEGSPTNPYINPEDLYEGYTSWRFGPNVVHWAYHIGWLGLNYFLALWAVATYMIAQSAYGSRITKIYERGKREWKEYYKHHRRDLYKRVRLLPEEQQALHYMLFGFVKTGGLGPENTMPDDVPAADSEAAAPSAAPAAPAQRGRRSSPCARPRRPSSLRKKPE